MGMGIRILIRWCCITAFIFVSRQVLAAEEPFFVQRYDNSNGLSNSAINYLFKDSDNLLWIATWDGLNMYDGNQFHVFDYNRDNHLKNIASNVIQQIGEDKAGNIWITTIEGISRYQKKSGRFHNYFYTQHLRNKISEQEYAVAIDNNGNVFGYSQSKGLRSYNAQLDSFVACNTIAPIGPISKMLFDTANRLWLLNAAGTLTAFTVNNNQLHPVQQYIPATGVSNVFFSNQRVFYSTVNDQLFSVQATSLHAMAVMQLPHPLSSMVFYKDHYLLAWATKGYTVVNAAFNTADFLQNETRQMEDIKVTAWANGSEDILWYGTDGNGIIKISAKRTSFATINTAENGLPYNKSVRAFCESNGNLWVATKGSGIINYPNFWNQSTGDQSKSYIVAPNTIGNNAVYALKRGHDDLIYIGSDAKGLDVYDTKTNQFHKWQSIAGADSGPAFGSVYAIQQDNDNSLWLGTSGFGLVHLKINRHNNGSLGLVFLQRFMFTNSNKGPANDIIYAITASDTNHLWIGCRYGGLNLLDKTTLTFKTYKALSYNGSLSNNDVLSLFKDQQDRLWIGTSYGLNWVNNADAVQDAPPFKKITIEQGLPNNTIHAISEDSLGNIWVSTNKGLATINGTNFSIRNYQQSDGLQSNEFCDGAVWKDASGNIFFGGTYGFNHFAAERIVKSNWQPNLLLSGISMGGKNTIDHRFMVIKPTGNAPFKYVLTRKDNFFELDIKAISFLNAAKCEFAYFLEGHDKTWHYAGTNGKISYSNLLPGNYTLRVKWSNGDAVWTEEIVLVDVEVQQYFWLTGYAILLYAALLGMLGYLVYRNSKNKQAIRQQLAVEQVLREKEEAIHQNRLGFFTNIAHELQTPLTLIMGSAERFIEKSTGTKEKPYFLTLIHQQAARLTYLVHQLLEFRKVESGYINNQFSQLDISALLQNLAEPFNPLSEQNKLDYSINIAPGMMGWVDKDKIEKIVFNLLSNAFKHAGKNEQVSFTAKYEQDTNALQLAVSNSGGYLPEGNIDKLFEKFYAAAPNVADNSNFGTGIGLAFTRQLVTLLKGTIAANSQDGRITFKVCLPLQEQPAIVPPPESNKSLSDQPSYLYQTITSYPNTRHSLSSAAENNKQSIVDNLQQQERKKILMVDDDVDIRFILKDLLKDEYIVYEADDGVKALELMEMVIPDIVICDVMMPHMNGLDMCNRLKNNPATCHIPVILLSARGSEDHHMEGYEVGADAYIAKPFESRHLKLRIRRLLEHQQKLIDLFKNEAVPEVFANADMTDGEKDFLLKLVALINERIDDASLNAEYIEKTLCLSKMQLYRKLKTLTGMTPGEFIKHNRLQQAALLLKSTDLNVTEIFYRTGFNNQSYFFREFKKVYQASPAEYREQHQ